MFRNKRIAPLPFGNNAAYQEGKSVYGSALKSTTLLTKNVIHKDINEKLMVWTTTNELLCMYLQSQHCTWSTYLLHQMA